MGSDSEAEDDDAAPDVVEGEDAADTEGAGSVGKKTPVKKRRRRQNVADKYDVEDPFIDDSEALMEQVAAASKDGFFVYSGPLIAEGERAKIDKYLPLLSWAKYLIIGPNSPRRERRRQRNPRGRKCRGQRKGKRKRRASRRSLKLITSMGLSSFDQICNSMSLLL